MSKLPQVLWLSGSPSLQCFDRPLLSFLAGHVDTLHWQYYQEKDEQSCLDQAVDLLHEYRQEFNNPVHLIGHGISGAIGLLYAQRHPEQVRSLTLLAVAAQPALTWHTHYYVQRHLTQCSRQQLLASQVRSLFGSRTPYPPKDLVRALSKDLEEAPSPHSLFKLIDLPRSGISAPLMVCGSKNDPVVNAPILQEWRHWLKPKDMLWECSSGYHFFHYYHPRQVGEAILQFWQDNFPKSPALPSIDLDGEKFCFAQCRR